MDFRPDRYSAFLTPLMMPRRHQHSLGVMRVMGDLSEVYDLDTAQAMTAGLLHDAARDLPLDDLLALAREARIAFSHPAEAHPIYLHAPVGAYLVKKDAGISDPSVLRAIAAHSHVDPADDSDGMLTQCLRAADVLAPISDWKGMARLKSLAYAGRMEEAALLHAGWLVEHFQNEGIPVHPHLHDTVRRLSAKLGPTEAFFERW